MESSENQQDSLFDKMKNLIGNVQRPNTSWNRSSRAFSTVTNDDDFMKIKDVTIKTQERFKSVKLSASPPSQVETKWKEDFLHYCLKYTYSHPIMRFS